MSNHVILILDIIIELLIPFYCLIFYSSILCLHDVHSRIIVRLASMCLSCYFGIDLISMMWKIFIVKHHMLVGLIIL